ncbi:MAG: hypothetical protein ACPGNT_11590, partial [Rhodospirillales bacterium]
MVSSSLRRLVSIRVVVFIESDERLLREDPMPEVEDTDGRNKRDSETGKPTATNRCFVSLARSFKLESRGEKLKHRIVYGWHFPNLYGRRIQNG